MGERTHFETKELPNVIVVGKEIRSSMEKLALGDNPIPKFWDECFAAGIFFALEAQKEHLFYGDYVGFMTDWGVGGGDFSYVVGMMMREGAQVPDGYIAKDLPAGKVGIAWIRGLDARDVCANAHELTVEAIQKHGHACQTAQWCMELYNCPRFTTPDRDGRITLDYYIPLE